MKLHVREIFDQKASALVQTNKIAKVIPKNPYKKFLLDLVSECIPRKLSARGLVIEVGCGFGASGYPIHLSNRMRWYIGCDISAKSLKKLKENLKGLKKDFILCDAESLPIRNSCATLVFSSHAIEHFPNIVKGLAEMHRVLKKDGYVFVITPNAWGLPERFISFKQNLFRNCNYRLKVGHVSLQNPYSLRRMMMRAGFKIGKETTSLIIYDGGLDIPMLGKFMSTAPIVYLISRFSFKVASTLLKIEHWTASRELFRKIGHDIVMLAQSRQSMISRENTTIQQMRYGQA